MKSLLAVSRCSQGGAPRPLGLDPFPARLLSSFARAGAAPCLKTTVIFIVFEAVPETHEFAACHFLLITLTLSPPVCLFGKRIPSFLRSRRYKRQAGELLNLGNFYTRFGGPRTPAAAPPPPALIQVVTYSQAEG